jgi:hypothetical protein
VALDPLVPEDAVRCAVDGCHGTTDAAPWLCPACLRELHGPAAAPPPDWVWAGPLPCHLDPDRWFPTEYDRAATRRAAATCLEHCPALDACRLHAERVNPHHGVWGGESWRGGWPQVKRRRSREARRVAAVD